MKNLVSVVNGQPVTTSEIIAVNSQNEHASVIKLVRTYLDDLEEFGRVGFEIAPFETVGGVQKREIALLNEHQSTLLLTYMKNTEIIRRFKKALVKEFFVLAKRPQPKKDASALPEFRKARAVTMMTNVADHICSRFPNLGTQSQQAIYASLVNPIAGDIIVPLPILECRTYSATEVGEKLGVTAAKVGRIANKLEIKNEQYGIFVLDKSPHSNKQVETFRYNDLGIEKIAHELSIPNVHNKHSASYN